MAGARVNFESKEGKRDVVASREDGSYEIDLPEDEYTVSVKYVGFHLFTKAGVVIKPHSLTTLNITLKEIINDESPVKEEGLQTQLSPTEPLPAKKSLLPVHAAAQEPTLKDTTESKYKVGQLWSYKTRPNEKKSSFIVVKVENHPKLGNIVHIALRDLKMKKPNGDFIHAAGHLPFAEDAINKSAVKLQKENADLGGYEEGYSMWREAFDAGKAGVYTITIAEAVNVMEATLNR